ncbi:MAG: hypothetical protein E7395_00255 [Ruminococcaceae bacterium]|nr:hypothetical protein [Oscillospiraceae bacterium]
MEYKKLPPVRNDKFLELEHFPSRFHAAVFRLWETVDAERIAKAIGVDIAEVKKAAEDMGLASQRYTDIWSKLGYITTIRNAWHILPYNQLLKLLDWSEEKLAMVLKEDDFLFYKLGDFKPYCPQVLPEKLSSEQKLKLSKIKTITKKYFSGMFEGAKPFDFFDDSTFKGKFCLSDDIRMIYSYCGLYAGVLDNDISVSYPDKLLQMYRSAGINSIWIPIVLYQVTPFPFDESCSEGWQTRLKRLGEIVGKAERYGIKVYLYLNEPRSMPLDFFDKHPDLKGATQNMYAAMCTSNEAVMKYLRDSIRTLCEAVPGIGGFLAITCSENLTHCKSREEASVCARCKDVPISKLIAQVICAISEESRKVNPNIRTIAWAWAWNDYMTKSEIKDCIDRIPKEVVIQCNSEVQKEFTIGGVKGWVSDYSMSIPGPGALAEFIWDYAKSKGHEISAKVQVNVTWECSTVPFLPVFDLIREHMIGLRRSGVEHLMLSWTLGGYPSVNLKIASACLEEPSEEKYIALLKEEFGEYAENVRKSTKLFSDAFREFPFDIFCLYEGPQNGGPSNLLYAKPSGFNSTMTCYAYDDIDRWRSIYPRDVYINQFKKLSDGWRKGLDEINSMPDCAFKQAAWGGYALFYSSYLQSEFVDKRDSDNKAYLAWIAKEEKQNALLMYDLMQKSSLFGYEAANHYYFNKSMLAEKVINCEYICDCIDSM